MGIYTYEYNYVLVGQEEWGKDRELHFGHFAI